MKNQKYKYHLVMIDSVEGDAIFYNKEKNTYNYICFPYYKEDIEEIEPNEVSVLKFNEIVQTGFSDFLFMVEYIDKVYLLDKLNNPNYKKVSEIAYQVRDAKSLFEKQSKDTSKNKSQQILSNIEDGKEIGYFYPRYIEGNLFNYTITKKPKYVNAFITNLRNILKREVKYLPSKRLSLKEIKTKNFNSIVDQSISGDRFIAEPVYAGSLRKERANLIKFAEIKTFCVLCREGSQIHQNYIDNDIEPLEIKDYAKPTFTLRNEAGSFKDFYNLTSQMREPKVVMIPSSLISEEFEKISDEYQSIKGNVENINNNHSDDPNEILRKVEEQSYSALLDWKIALSLKKEGGKKYKLFVLRYDTPIDVGLFYPKGDLKFKNWIENAIEGSYKENGSWSKEFEKHMSRSMATLIPIDDYLIERKINSA